MKSTIHDASKLILNRWLLQKGERELLRVLGRVKKKSLAVTSSQFL